VACVGGGSNALGLFHPFLADEDVALFGVEAAGEGIASGRHAAALNGGRPGVLHGARSYILQDGDGQVQEAHSISAGLDYPGVGPEHAWLHSSGRARYLVADDEGAIAALERLAALEGIIPALESAHALAALPEVVEAIGGDGLLIVNLSGRGDKDLESLQSRGEESRA
ncbi:MAG: pyridoxal-phosphate dependent enzyme, partial [Caulobacteraceae bacterium]